MAIAYKAVCQILKNSCTPVPNDICCLCFNSIGEDPTQIHDEVVLNSSHGLITEQMSKILMFLLGDEFSEMLSTLQSMCDRCVKMAINSYKFITTCRENAKSMESAIDNLTSCFEHTADDISSFQTMYVAVEEDLTMEQFYDNKRLPFPQDTALARFQFITQGRRVKTELKKEVDEMKPVKVKDYSTIFIKTNELVHDPNDPRHYKCKMCLRIYPNSGSLRQHFFSVHFKKDYQCTDCPKSFGTAGLLQTHKIQSHSFVTCNDCGKNLLCRSSTLKRHALTHHTKAGRVCHRCGRSYKKITDFNRHMEQDTCTMPSRVRGEFVCDYCGKVCHFKHQILAHIRYEHLGGEGHVCTWCNKKCYSASALKTHVLKHTREKNFVCQDCGGKFVTRQSLINHTRLHTGERPYPCEYCDLSFLSASRRRDHVERHHVGSIFECDLCDAKYNAKRSLLKHRKRHFDSSVTMVFKDECREA